MSKRVIDTFGLSLRESELYINKIFVGSLDPYEKVAVRIIGITNNGTCQWEELPMIKIKGNYTKDQLETGYCYTDFMVIDYEKEPLQRKTLGRLIKMSDNILLYMKGCPWSMVTNEIYFQVHINGWRPEAPTALGKLYPKQPRHFDKSKIM